MRMQLELRRADGGNSFGGNIGVDNSNGLGSTYLGHNAQQVATAIVDHFVVNYSVTELSILEKQQLEANQEPLLADELHAIRSEVQKRLPPNCVLAL